MVTTVTTNHNQNVSLDLQNPKQAYHESQEKFKGHIRELEPDKQVDLLEGIKKASTGTISLTSGGIKRYFTMQKLSTETIPLLEDLNQHIEWYARSKPYPSDQTEILQRVKDDLNQLAREILPEQALKVQQYYKEVFMPKLSQNTSSDNQETSNNYNRNTSSSFQNKLRNLLNIDPKLEYLQTDQKSHLLCLSFDSLSQLEYRHKFFLENFKFGKEKWNQCFGDVGVEPPLPPNIQQILQSPCPFWHGKSVEQTHILVLVPTAVKGIPLTLKSLGKLMESPKQGHASQYKHFASGNYTDEPAAKAHWVLMTRDVIPGSRNKSYADQQALVAGYAQQSQAPYEIPYILDATVTIWMHYVATGNRLYNDTPHTWTCCQEEYDATRPLAVGDFSLNGLYVFRSCFARNNFARNNFGVGCSRKL